MAYSAGSHSPGPAHPPLDDIGIGIGRGALRPAGDCMSAAVECSIIAQCTVNTAVTHTE